MKGVDGTSSGWIVADFDGERFEVYFIEDLLELESPAFVDVPVGLPEDEVRDCDEEARSFLAPERHYSVFTCPVREAVFADAYEEACDINEEKTGRRISKQTWNIVPKIREAERAVSDGAELYECHPEVVFKKLDESAVEDSKLSEEGFRARLEALCSASGVPKAEVVACAEDSAGDRDDVLDAMALAFAASEGLDPIMSRRTP